MLTSVILALAIQGNDVVDGIKSVAIPLKSVEAGNGFVDLAAFDKSLEGVEVVGMGEPTHGSREVFQFKHRMFEYLVEKHGYTVFALESSMPDTIAMDEYVLHGKGTPEAAALAQGFWTWSTQEVVDLLKWMRAYNVEPKHTKKLRVVGIDMQSQVGATMYYQRVLEGMPGEPDDALFWEDMSWEPPTAESKKKFDEIVTKYGPEVRKRDGEEAERLFKQMAVVFNQAVDEQRINDFRASQMKAVQHMQDTFAKVTALRDNAQNLPVDAKNGLDFLVEHTAKLVVPESIDSEEFMKQAKSLRAHAATKPSDAQLFVRSAEILEFLAKYKSIADLSPFSHRDKCMAENLDWVRTNYLPGSKVMVWAHNYHIARINIGEMQTMMGSYIDRKMGAKYLPVGFSFYEGAFQAIGPDSPLQEWKVGPAKSNSLDEVFSKIGKSPFLIDFSRLTGAAKTWAATEQITRNYGAVNDPKRADAFYGPMVPSEFYRAMVFIPKTTRARPIADK